MKRFWLHVVVVLGAWAFALAVAPHSAVAQSGIVQVSGLRGTSPVKFYEMATCPTTKDGGTVSYCQGAIACATGTCTSGVPPQDAGWGMSLTNATAFRVTLCAPSAQFLNGPDAGVLHIGYYVPAEGLWQENGHLQQQIDGTGQCETFPDFSVGVPYGRVSAWATARVLYSDAGPPTTSTLDLLIDGVQQVWR